MLPSFIGICHVGGGGGCPAAGTLLRYDNVIYPVAEGGAYVRLFSDGDWFDASIYYPSQLCDVAIRADGACGEYQDFSTVQNITYRPNGVFLSNSVTIFDVPKPSEFIINCTDVIGSIYQYPGYYYKEGFLDGTGSYYIADGSNNYYEYGTPATYGSISVNGPGCDPDNPIEVNVFCDGSGSYYYTSA